MSKNENAADLRPMIFFIKNSDHNMQATERYLDRRGFQFKSENNPALAVEIVESLKPKYVFLASDHKDPYAKEITSQLIPEESLLIPYATSTTRNDLKNLLEKKSPFKLLPPVSGPSIQRLILAFEKTKQKSETNTKNNISTTVSGNTTKGLSNVNMIKGTSMPAAQMAIGDRTRLGDLKKQNEKLPDGEINYNSIFETVTDLTLDNPIVHLAKHVQIKINEGQKRLLENSFDQSIQKDLTDAIEFNKKNSTSLNQENNLTETSSKAAIIYCVLVRSMNCSGFILLHSEWVLSIEDVESSILTWANQLSYHNKKASTDLTDLYQSNIFPLDLKASKTDLHNLVSILDRATVKKELEVDSKKTIMAYFDLPHSPFDLETAANSDYLIINPYCITLNSNTNSDLFIELTENKKIIKLFNFGTEITTKEIESIRHKSEFPIMIDASDEINWYEYGITNFLKTSADSNSILSITDKNSTGKS